MASAPERALLSEDLIRLAGELGVDIGRRTLERWREEHLIPPARRVGRGIGLGTRWEYPAGTDRQVCRLLELRRQSERSARLRPLLWWEGFPVPWEAVREDFCRLRPSSAGLNELASMTDDELQKAADSAHDTIDRQWPRPPGWEKVEDEARRSLLMQAVHITARGALLTTPEDEADGGPRIWGEMGRLLGINEERVAELNRRPGAGISQFMRKRGVVKGLFQGEALEGLCAATAAEAEAARELVRLMATVGVEQGIAELGILHPVPTREGIRELFAFVAFGHYVLRNPKLLAELLQDGATVIERQRATIAATAVARSG